MLASESILTVVTAHFGTHGKKFTYISRNWYRLIDKFKWVKFYSTEGLHTELLVRKNPKCQHYYIPVSGDGSRVAYALHYHCIPSALTRTCSNAYASACFV